MPTNRWTGDRLEQALREIVVEDGDVSCEEFCRQVGVSRSLIYRRFRDWAELRERAGMFRRKRRPSTRRITADEVRAALRELVETEGPGITLKRFERLSGFSGATIDARFGSWNKLRELEGLPPNRTRTPVIDFEELLSELWRLKRKLGRIPKSHEIARQARYSLSTYYNRVGRMGTIRVLLTPHLLERAVAKRLQNGTLTREKLQQAFAERERRRAGRADGASPARNSA